MAFLNIIDWAQNGNVVFQNSKIVVRSGSRNAKSVPNSCFKAQNSHAGANKANCHKLLAPSNLPTDRPTNAYRVACTRLKVAMLGPNMAEWWPYRTVRAPYNQDGAHKVQVRAQRARVEAQKV